MNGNVQPLDKHPPLDPSRDFYRLRREGIGHIQQAGSGQWTDYNLHDPGITILEALCYAITDIGYRTGWRIEDILAPQTPSADPARPYPGQAFFTAREILTVNPTTVDDFRRLLIDLPGVRDAWVVCKRCACEASYWAYCDLAGQLVLQFPQPHDPPHPATEAWALGLYETLLELEDDPELGDLNDRMVAYATVYHDGDGAHPVVMEMRFPDLSLLEREAWQSFLQAEAFTIELVRLGATRTYDVFDLPDPADRDAYLREQWNGIFYVSLRIQPAASAHVLDVPNATLRVLADGAVRDAASAQEWRTLLTDPGPGGFVARYRRKAKAAVDAVAEAKVALHRRRNLGEDYCLIACAGVEEVAVCADVEVRPDADIERVQGAIWFELEQYMAPPIPFRTLQELQGRGVPVEDIFDGPALANGFIEDTDLEVAALKSMLRTSDIVHCLMGIDGVMAVNQLRMTKYDAGGNVVAGAADPAWVDGSPVYDPGKTSAAWLLAVRPRHQPRLYLNQSRFLFYKDALPFLPRMDEALDTLAQLRGEAERPKNPGAPNDLPIPPGTYRHPEDYFPVQYGFPLAYGIGPDGLPPRALPARKAQAKNLKAYLMVYEQLLGNALAQLAHTADLFSLDPTVARTYFAKAFDETVIKELDDIADTARLTPAAVGALLETPAQFQARRNAFLDHLLARFGEQFGEYALLLTQASGEAVAQPRLIESKIAFLRRYPAISRDRAKAFDYRNGPGDPGNDPGIKKRIGLLLGHPDLAFAWTVGEPSAGTFTVDYGLVDGIGARRMQGTLAVAADSGAQARRDASRLLLQRMILEEAYAIEPVADGKVALVLSDAAATGIGRSPPLASQDDARSLRDTLLAWSANERMLVVEHVLLRPKFIGDALYPACCEAECSTCDNADPYSFRLTYVMPGWTRQYTRDLDLRRYADRTIQRETPSHLLAKICWVGNDGYVENPCDEAVDRLADLLLAHGETASHTPASPEGACTCAHAIHHAFSEAFAAWFADRKFAFLRDDALASALDQLFRSVSPPQGDCTTVITPALWDRVRASMTSHFTAIARGGWQFERFEWAWYAWLDANAAIDWSEERLVERVEAILAANLLAASPGATPLCDCALRIVAGYGAGFHAWMRDNLAAGRAFEDLPPFDGPAVTLCADHSFSPDARSKVATLLKDRYDAYVGPSYRLWVVVNLLAGLRNTYPGATLHDCDQGGDLDPVRLDNTALGNYPRRTTL